MKFSVIETNKKEKNKQKK